MVLVVMVEGWAVRVVPEEGGVYHADLVDSACKKDIPSIMPWLPTRERQASEHVPFKKNHDDSYIIKRNQVK